MESLQIIGDEHQSLAAILHAIRFMLKEVAAERLAADRQLFQAMVHYLDAYAEQRHHPKEDVLFRHLATCTQEGGEALAALALQHAAAPARIAALQQALADYLADESCFDRFAEAFETYANFYRGHMLLEEEAILPLARRVLSAADWQQVDAAFQAEAARTARAEGSEDFKALFSRLVDCAPAPVGFGPRPWQG